MSESENLFVVEQPSKPELSQNLEKLISGLLSHDRALIMEDFDTWEDRKRAVYSLLRAENYDADQVFLAFGIAVDAAETEHLVEITVSEVDDYSEEDTEEIDPYFAEVYSAYTNWLPEEQVEMVGSGLLPIENFVDEIGPEADAHNDAEYSRIRKSYMAYVRSIDDPELAKEAAYQLLGVENYSHDDIKEQMK